MTGQQWVNRHRKDDLGLVDIAYNAQDNITVPSRIRRKAVEYTEARFAFMMQLAKNGIYVS